MSALKSIFRRKSKKGLRSETPTNEPPSPSRVPQPDSWNNSPNSQASSTGTYPPRSNVANRNSLPSRQAPQDPSTLVDNESLPYDNLPTGAQPQRGTVPIHGNAAALPGALASNGAAMQSNTPQKLSNAQNSQQRRSVPPPGTAVSNNQDSYGQRPTSRSSGYTSKYSTKPDVRLCALISFAQTLAATARVLDVRPQAKKSHQCHNRRSES